jgi:hypothetical protein
MRIREQDLVQAFQSRGEAFEEFVRDLVRAVGHSCGIDPIHLDWDYRTNVPDGGRDLVVKAPNKRSDKRFIPEYESIWSLKSGVEGVSPAALKKEVTDDKHPKVREALEKGWTYVWCTVNPAKHDTKDKMREAADEVADLLGINHKQFEFRWLDNLVAEANLYPNVISDHLSEIATRLADVRSLKQWSRHLELCEDWVNFGGRDDVVQKITEHLLGRQSPNILHIAGLSGIGKTRTVFEACRRQPELNGVFYVERFEHVSPGLYRYLEEDGRNVQLIVDETLLHEVEKIAARLGDFADRIRVVTIGPAVRQAPISTRQTIILPEPDTEAGVLEVVRAAGVGLPDEVCRGIAEQSGHDLRLALLLVRASRQLPAFRGIPVFNFDGVWERLMALFANRIGDPNRFRERYEVLTVSNDVGLTEDVGGEVGLLAKLFDCSVDHLLSVVNDAAACGLGIRTRRFFEATPRALAARLFETRVWCRIRDRLEDFALELLGHSDRLARRFFQRCQDCAGDVREEVMDRVGDFFLKALHGEDVTVLSSRNTSRLFETWAEFDPDRGLSWLRQAVERASAEQLLALDGQPDASGGWRGRRQLVWLCQNMASFAEHFEACEAILFRLALHETEPEIGNNSSAIWQGLFWPILAATEVPFEQRLPILLGRLRAAKVEELPLVLAAALGSIEYRSIGLPAPPRVVGGRVVPPPWKPKTYAELGQLRRDAARLLLDTLGKLPEDRAPVALSFVADYLHNFRGLGVLDHVQKLFHSDGLSEPIRRRLVASLDNQIAFLREKGKEGQANSELKLLEEWLAQLAPVDLAARVRDLTAQTYWQAWDHEGRMARFDSLAKKLVTQPEMFCILADWFDSPEAISTRELAFRVGVQDGDARLAGIVRDWLRADRCRQAVVGYLGGAAARCHGLSTEWADLLDTLATEKPELTASVTTSVDFTLVDLRACSA